MRSLRSVRSAMTLMPTNSTTAQMRAMAAAAPRDAKSLIMVRVSSIRLLEVDEDHVGKQEDADHRGEEDGVAQVDDALGDRAEMAEEAERGDGREHARRRPALQQAQHDRRSAHGEQEARRGGDDEGDDLVLGQRR